MGCIFMPLIHYLDYSGFFNRWSCDYNADPHKKYKAKSTREYDQKEGVSCQIDEDFFLDRCGVGCKKRGSE